MDGERRMLIHLNVSLSRGQVELLERERDSRQYEEKVNAIARCAVVRLAHDPDALWDAVVLAEEV